MLHHMGCIFLNQLDLLGRAVVLMILMYAIYLSLTLLLNKVIAIINWVNILLNFTIVIQIEFRFLIVI
jgi:hypothetical protein